MLLYYLILYFVNCSFVMWFLEALLNCSFVFMLFLEELQPFLHLGVSPLPFTKPYLSDTLSSQYNVRSSLSPKITYSTWVYQGEHLPILVLSLPWVWKWLCALQAWCQLPNCFLCLFLLHRMYTMFPGQASHWPFSYQNYSPTEVRHSFSLCLRCQNKNGSH